MDVKGLVDERQRGDVGSHGAGEEEEEEGQEGWLVLVVVKECCAGLQGRVGFGRGCCRLGRVRLLC